MLFTASSLAGGIPRYGVQRTAVAGASRAGQALFGHRDPLERSLSYEYHAAGEHFLKRRQYGVTMESGCAR